VYDTVTGQRLHVLHSPSRETHSIAFSPNGGQLVVGNSVYEYNEARPSQSKRWGEANVWNVVSGRRIHTLRLGRDVGSVAFSPDGRHILTGEGLSAVTLAEGEFHEVVLWDAASGRRLRDFSGQTHLMNDVAFSSDGRRVLTAGYDGRIRQWDVSTGQPLPEYSGDLSNVYHLAMAPDGKRALTASDTYGEATRLVLWDVQTRAMVRGVNLPVDDIRSMAWSHDGKLALVGAGGFDEKLDRNRGFLFLVDIAGGRTLRVDEFEEDLSALALSPDGRLGHFKAGYGESYLYRPDTGERLKKIVDCDAAAFSPHGKLFAAAGDRGLTLYDVGSLDTVRTLASETDFESVAFSGDGKRIAAGTSGNDTENAHALVWDVASGQTLGDFETLSGDADSVSLSADGAKLLVCSRIDENHAVLLDVATGKQLQNFCEEDDDVDVYAAAISPDGLTVLTGADKRTVVWDAHACEQVGMLSGHLDAPQAIAFTSDGKRMVSSGTYYKYVDGQQKNFSQVLVWDAESARQIGRVDDLAGTALSMALAPDGSQALMDLDGATVVDLKSGQIARSFRHSRGSIHVDCFDKDGLLVHTEDPEGIRQKDLVSGHEHPALKPQNDEPIETLAQSPDRRYLLTRGEDTVASLWDTATGERIHSLRGHTWKIISAAYSPDGRYVATAAGNLLTLNNGDVIVWDVNSGASVLRFQLDTEYTVNLDFSPHGNRLLTCSHHLIDKTPAGSNVDSLDRKTEIRGDVFVWDVRSGRKLLTLPSSGTEGRAGAFSPDGRYIVTDALGKGNHAALWDARSGRRLRHFRHGTEGSTLFGLAFTRDGRMLATLPMTLSDRGEIHIWDIATGTLLRSFHGHESAIGAVQFGPDGKHVISESGDGNPILWDVYTGQQVARLFSAGQDGDVLAVTPHGLFDGPPTARQQITFRVGNGLDVVPVERFFQDFYRPGLVYELLQTHRPLPTVEVGGKVAPQVRIVSPATGSIVNTPQIAIEVEVTDRGDGVKGPWIKHNGAAVIVPGQPRRTGDTVRRTFNVPLVEGDNTFEVTAATVDGSWESEPVRLELQYKEATGAAQLHLVAVGVNRFAEESINLRFAAPDARAVAEIFQKRAPTLYGKDRVQVTQLLDDRATKDGVLGALADVSAKAKPQDTFCLFLAGHGTMVGQRYFFIPHEFKASQEKLDNDIVAQGLAGDELDDAISRIPALKRIVIYDTCQSGGAMGVSRTARSPFQFRKAMESMSRSQGSFVIAATAATDEAQEVPELGHGVLTYALLAGVGAVDKGPLKRRTARADDEEKVVKVREWLGFAQDEVPILTRAFFGQEQFIRFTGAGSNFAVLPLD